MKQNNENKYIPRTVGGVPIYIQRTPSGQASTKSKERIVIPSPNPSSHKQSRRTSGTGSRLRLTTARTFPGERYLVPSMAWAQCEVTLEQPIAKYNPASPGVGRRQVPYGLDGGSVDAKNGVRARPDREHGRRAVGTAHAPKAESHLVCTVRCNESRVPPAIDCGWLRRGPGHALG